MKKNLLKTKLVLLMALLCTGLSSAWAAGYTRTLTENFELAGYKAKQLYDFQNNTPAVLPLEGGLRYRDGGIWGLHNFESGGRSATAAIPVSEGDVLVLQHYSSDNISTIDCGTLDDVLTTGAGYQVYKISKDAESITFSIARYGGIVAAFVMEVDTDAATAEYTINYVLGSQTVKTVTGVGVVGGFIPTAASFFVDEAKYIRAAGAAETVTIAETGNTFNVEVRQAESWTYTVNYTDGTNPLGSKSLNVIEGEKASFAYSQYIALDGQLYKSTAQTSNPWWGKDFTPTENNAVQTITYTAVANATNIVFCKEAENITGLNTVTGGNTDIRTSNRAGAFASEDGTVVVTLPAGKYKMMGAVYGNAGTTITFTAGSNTIFSLATSGNPVHTESEEFTLTAETDIVMAGGNGGNSPKVLDYLIIQKTGEYTPEEPVVDENVFGSKDFTTTFMVAHKDFTIKAGTKTTIVFENHGNGEKQWFNWVLRLSGVEGVDHTFRADNYVIGDANSEVSTRSIEGVDFLDEASNSTFIEEMKNATVTMEIVYGHDGKFSVNATSVGENKTYIHHFAYNNALSGDVLAELGVDCSWFKFISAETENLPTPVVENTYTATFTTNVDWQNIYAYVWVAEGNEPLGAWPGTQIAATNGTYSISFESTDAPAEIEFNNGGFGEGNQVKFAFENGKAYDYTVVIDEGDYEITISDAEEGGELLTNRTKANEDDDVTFTAKADQGYKLDKVLIQLTTTAEPDGASVELSRRGATAENPTLEIGDIVTIPATEFVDGKYTFKMYACDIFVKPVFVADQTPQPTTYSVTIIGTDVNGSVTANPTTAEAGATIVLTITPNQGYELDKLKINNIEVTVTGNTYTTTMPEGGLTVYPTFKLIEVPVQKAKLTLNTEWTTFYSPVTMELADGVEAYTVSDVIIPETEGLAGTVQLVKRNYIAKNVPMILHNTALATSGTKTFELVINEDAETGIAPNPLGAVFKGTSEDITVGKNEVYVLKNGKFVLYSGTSIKKYNCYIDFPYEPEVKARSLNFEVVGDQTTGIKALNRVAVEGQVYDLQGRQMDSAVKKGIYVIGGKKVVIK